jgi:hypothetical protein
VKTLFKPGEESGASRPAKAILDELCALTPLTFRLLDLQQRPYRENLEKRTYGVILADKHVLVNEKITLWCKKLKFAKYELN